MNEFNEFLGKLAKSGTGKKLIEYLEAVQIHYADVRNLQGSTAEIRIEALKIIDESLLGKLKVLSGAVVPPNGNEWD